MRPDDVPALVVELKVPLSPASVISELGRQRAAVSVRIVAMYELLFLLAAQTFHAGLVIDCGRTEIQHGVGEVPAIDEHVAAAFGGKDGSAALASPRDDLFWRAFRLKHGAVVVDGWQGEILLSDSYHSDVCLAGAENAWTFCATKDARPGFCDAEIVRWQALPKAERTALVTMPASATDSWLRGVDLWRRRACAGGEAYVHGDNALFYVAPAALRAADPKRRGVACSFRGRSRQCWSPPDAGELRVVNVDIDDVSYACRFDPRRPSACRALFGLNER